MLFFHQLFPEIGISETRTASILVDGELAADSYAFLECYCVERGCDCRRVLIKVLSKKRGREEATINHAFDPPAPDDLDGLQEGQTFLDPLHPRTSQAKALLDLFVGILSSPGYEERLERHYAMVKDALEDPAHPIHRVIAQADGPALPGRERPRRPTPASKKARMRRLEKLKRKSRKRNRR